MSNILSLRSRKIIEVSPLSGLKREDTACQTVLFLFMIKYELLVFKFLTKKTNTCVSFESCNTRETGVLN